MTISQCPINAIAEANVRIGEWNAVYFTGQIDDVRIYDRALSQAEIALIAQ